jgi:hypothetical protein
MSGTDNYFRSGHSHHDVFISYAQHDKPIADAVCARLEARHIRCWIAPRDVSPSKEFPAAIIEGIDGSGVMVLIFSSYANNSPHVIRELTNAVNKGRIIVPFRIEDVAPSKSMEYLISVPHWLDAITPPIEKHIDKLADSIEHILSPGPETAVCSSCKTPLSGNPRFCEKCGTPVLPAPPDMNVPPSAQPVFPPPPLPVSGPPPSPAVVTPPRFSIPGNRKLLIGAGAFVLVLVALYLALPIITGSTPETLRFLNGESGAAPVPAVANTTMVNYRGENAPVNTVLLTAGPTQALPEGTQLFIQADKNSINAEVNVQFTGGPGQGLVKDNQVILTRSDGTVTQGTLDFNQRLSEVSLQGSRGTDRLQVIVTLRSGVTYTIMDKLMPYRVRGIEG